jgi:hypothetical protein
MTAYRDFFEILKEVGLYDEKYHNKTENTYTLNGNLIEFFSTDDAQKIRGRKRNVLFCNEGNELELEDWRQLVLRTTGKIIIDYNPSDFEHWIYEQVIPREDAALLITTYKDNPHLPDSLKFKTLIQQRTVYSGGGIMPDIFVPVDTLEMTDSYRALMRSGTLNSFTLTYVDKNRATLAKKYTSYENFKKNFSVDAAYMNDYLSYAKSENAELELKDDELKISDELLKTRMKASLAQNIWGISEFYEINNHDNEILQRAIKALNSDEYSKAGLAN